MSLQRKRNPSGPTKRTKKMQLRLIACMGPKHDESFDQLSKIQKMPALVTRTCLAPPPSSIFSNENDECEYALWGSISLSHRAWQARIAQTTASQTNTNTRAHESISRFFVCSDLFVVFVRLPSKTPKMGTSSPSHPSHEFQKSEKTQHHEQRIRKHDFYTPSYF